MGQTVLICPPPPRPSGEKAMCLLAHGTVQSRTGGAAAICRLCDSTRSHKAARVFHLLTVFYIETCGEAILLKINRLQRAGMGCT